jgi:hypothetical protein
LKQKMFQNALLFIDVNARMGYTYYSWIKVSKHTDPLICRSALCLSAKKIDQEDDTHELRRRIP